MQKKLVFLEVLLFTIGYAVFLGLGCECLLNLLGLAMAMSLDGGSAAKMYPRFTPFCFTIGLLALTALIFLAVLNAKKADRFHYTKRMWTVQWIFAFVLSIPMIALWEKVFDALQNTF